MSGPAFMRESCDLSLAELFTPQLRRRAAEVYQMDVENRERIEQAFRALRQALNGLRMIGAVDTEWERRLADSISGVGQAFRGALAQRVDDLMLDARLRAATEVGEATARLLRLGLIAAGE